jgi:GrpB-like predicted nucleotidyltransferase (UPF0157 family)/GNAT superfamily N-acetyltransferase
MTDDVRIAPWAPTDRDEVIDLVLGSQRGEFDLPVTLDDQPDLADVEAGYRTGGGEFLVARDAAGVAGTVAAMVVEDNTVALKKMFVRGDRRGTGLAVALLERLLDWARRHGYRTVLLGTTSRMHAAHRFYEREGFTRIEPGELPAQFPRAAVDDVFYRRDLAGVVSIREYDPRWPERYEAEAARMRPAFDGLPVEIHHVGSTSVPGLPAKPILDIALLVPDSADEARYAPRLEQLGYRFTLREADWFEHRLFNRDWPRVNLHVFSLGCDEAVRMIRFRDHLRRDTGDRELYLRAKRELAAREWAIVQDYADAKTSVVADIMTRVR